MPGRIQSSFRDPSGQVFDREGVICRTINASYQEHWEHLQSSGLLPALVQKEMVVPFRETAPLPGSWKSVNVERIPAISYPYEWSFPQLRDAALLTLAIQREALQAGMTLKDSSAYNVQFLGSKPVFIDPLSFEKRPPDAPWQAYRQFCMHFLAPLALFSGDPRLGRLSRLWIDGVPLDLAWSMLSWKSAFSPGLQMHLHLHAKAEQKYNDARKAAGKVGKARISTRALLDLTDSLIRTVRGLKNPAAPGEWTEYYTDTNYSTAAEDEKKRLVREAVRNRAGKLALDLGANTGKYSELLAPFFEQVVAADIDPQAVGRLYEAQSKTAGSRILPLVQDLGNPSPAIGWACIERDSWMQRWQADCVCALALTHHIFFSNGIPWPEQAVFFARQLKAGGLLVMEFVPREDSQVQRLLAARDDVFPDYTLEGCCLAFAELFQIQQTLPIADSPRRLLLLEKR